MKPVGVLKLSSRFLSSHVSWIQLVIKLSMHVGRLNFILNDETYNEQENTHFFWCCHLLESTSSFLSLFSRENKTNPNF